MAQQLATVDPDKEALFRQAYRRGWLSATRALEQLLRERDLAPQDAARVLNAHHGDALARWQHDRLGVAIYPPKVATRRRGNEGSE